jgi:hypothetical protein
MVNDSDKVLAGKFGHDIVGDHIGDCADEMIHNDNKEVPLSNFAADAYRAAANAQIGLESVQLTGEGIAAGPISTMGLYNAIPHIYQPFAGDSTKPFPQFGHQWTIKRLTILGSEFRGLFNFSMAGANIGLPTGFIAASGIKIAYTNSGGGSPLQQISVLNPATGKYDPMTDTGNYTIAIHDGLLLAIKLLIREFHLDINVSRIEETGIEAWQAGLQLLNAKNGQLRAADFETGSRWNTVEPDVAVNEHNVKPHGLSGGGYSVTVTVQNDGLGQAPAGKYSLRVLRSKPDDVIWDYTDGNESTPISADLAIPALNAGDHATLEVPWTDLPAGGMYSLKATIVGPGDGNVNNDSALIHYRVALKKP